MGGWLGLRVRDEQAILDGFDDVPVEVLGRPFIKTRVRIERASAFRQSIEIASAFRQSGAPSV
jgi:hypothetical protein